MLASESKIYIAVNKSKIIYILVIVLIFFKENE